MYLNHYSTCRGKDGARVSRAANIITDETLMILVNNYGITYKVDKKKSIKNQFYRDAAITIALITMASGARTSDVINILRQDVEESKDGSTKCYILRFGKTNRTGARRSAVSKPQIYNL